MRFLEVKLYDNTASGLNELSVVIQLHDRAGGKEQSATISKDDANPQSRHEDHTVTHDDADGTSSRQSRAAQRRVRLLPTDRLVLNALRARVPEGEQLTKPVRLQELMEECAISRRQAQICLKRLTEMELINRLSDGMSLGNKDGYPYKILQGLL